MDRPQLIPGLRIAWSAVFGILCVLLVVLWLRSYAWRDEVFGLPCGSGTLAIVSQEGTIEFVNMPASSNDIFGDTHFPTDEPLGFIPNLPSTLNRTGVVQPGPYIHHWTLIVLTAVVAAAPWIRWKRKFSLRTLLLATTLIAVLLATVAYLRLW